MATAELPGLLLLPRQLCNGNLTADNVEFERKRFVLGYESERSAFRQSCGASAHINLGLKIRRVRKIPKTHH